MTTVELTSLVKEIPALLIFIQQHLVVSGILLLVVFIYIFRQSLSFLITQLWFKIKEHNCTQKHTIQELKNHHIFKDLEHWTNIGIQIIKIPQSPVKERMAQDLLRIQFRVLQDSIRREIFNVNITDSSLQDLQHSYKYFIQRVQDTCVEEWQKEGFPSLFIERYLKNQKNVNDATFEAAEIFLSDYLDLDNSTRLYLILSIMSAHFSRIIASIASTILSINGDLNGYYYKGSMIGSGSTKMFVFDDKGLKEDIENMLTDLTDRTKSARAFVYRVHKNDTGLQYVSMIYENCIKGVSYEKENSQYIAATVMTEALKVLKEGKVFYGETHKLNASFREFLEEQGVKAFIFSPIIKDDELFGFVGISWIASSKYIESLSSVNLEQIVIATSLEIKEKIC